MVVDGLNQNWLKGWVIQIKAVLDEVRDTRYYIPYRLAVYGLRRGEICAITALDISDANILTIDKDKVYNGEKSG